jgi:hypothetical protein
MKGKILKLTTGIVVAPHTQVRGGWTCVILESKLPNYPVGGYDIHVFDDDLSLGVEMSVGPRREKAR